MLECGRRGAIICFHLKSSLPSPKNVFLNVLGSRELMLSFVQKKSEKRFVQINVCLEIFHTRFLVKGWP